MTLPKLCWLLYLIAAHFLFISELLAPCPKLENAPRRYAEIWAHLSESPFSLGRAFLRAWMCWHLSDDVFRQMVLVFSPIFLLLRSTINYSIIAWKLLLSLSFNKHMIQSLSNPKRNKATLNKTEHDMTMTSYDFFHYVVMHNNSWNVLSNHMFLVLLLFVLRKIKMLLKYSSEWPTPTLWHLEMLLLL